MFVTNPHGELVPPGVRSDWSWQDGPHASLPSWLGTVEPNYSGTGGPGAVYQDDFSTDAATVIGVLSPDVGGPYSEREDHAACWSVVGGLLTRTAALNGTRGTLRSAWTPRVGNDFSFTGTVHVPTAAVTGSVVEILVASTDEVTGRVGIEIDGLGTAAIKSYFNNTTATLATIPGAPHKGSAKTFRLALAGTTITAELGGNTATASLTQAQADLLGINTKTVLRSQFLNTTFDNLVVQAERAPGANAPTWESALHADGIYQHRAILAAGGRSWGEYRFNPTLDLSRFDAVQMRVEFKVDYNRPRHVFFGFTDDARSRGVEWGFMNESSERGFFGAYNSTRKYLGSHMPLLGVDGNAKRYTATLTVDCKDGTVYVGMSDGQVSDIWRNAPVALGTVQPRIRIDNVGQSTAQQIFTLHSVRISTWR